MSDDAKNLMGNWNYPTAMRFGVGRISELADACKALGMKKPLLVTDPGLAALPMVSDAIKANDAAGLPTGLYSNVKPNPVASNVEGGVKAYRDGGHDGVIAFGGGSALDAAKCVAFMSGQTRPIWDFEDVGDNWSRADPAGIAPIIAVPTTSGTGSEVGRAGVITNEETHTKKVIFHPMMMPGIVISDPALTVGLPPHITAGTGLDAFIHCFEAFCAPGFHPMAEGIAIEGMRLVKDWLPTAVEDGKNLQARANMLAAASMGATAFQKGLGAIHSLAHPVGAVYDVHHGLANAVFWPYVMDFNRDAISNRMKRLSRYLGLKNSNFDGMLEWTLEFRKSLNIPHTAREIGVEDSRLEELAEMAAVDPTASGNPIKVGPADMLAMYKAAMEGRIG
ncbi:MAG: iron-containing alcohol dehydrogenase [Rhodospirillaceae bacterium]|nr:iron-containing alcohol dehydrogenase [Rhodospirillaceae bacterium]